jgi:hypothetical protein
MSPRIHEEPLQRCSHRDLNAALHRGPLDPHTHSPLPHERPRMRTRPVTPRSPLALSQRCVTGFPLVQMFREAPARRWFWVGLVGHGATNHCPMVLRARLLGAGRPYANACFRRAGWWAPIELR